MALNVLLTDDEGNYLMSVAAIRPDQAATVRLRDLKDNYSFYVYAQDLSGKWYRTRAAYQGLTWDDGLGVANSFRGRLLTWRVPRKARGELDRTSETSWEYYQAVSSYFTIRGWVLRRNRFGIWIRIDLWRWLWSFPNARRVTRFRDRIGAPIAAPAAPEQRGAWPLEVDGEFACWKGPRQARQLSCQWEGEYLVCDVDLRSGIPGGVRGLICIERRAFEALPQDKARRSDLIRRKYGRYVCRVRPSGPFVFELRKMGPWLINWP